MKIDYLTKEKIIDILNNKVDNSITNGSQLPSWTQFHDMVKALTIFINAINNNKKILLIHDSDADGCGCYMLSYIYFNKIFKYQNIEMIITDRKKGYGFQPYHINDRVNTDQLPNLIITSDNGITSHDACNLAKKLNIEVIITDHHQVDQFKGLPNADAIVDPHKEECNFPYPDINGTFVYWYFLLGFHQHSKLDGNLLYEFLPELCLTTISDVMPLKNINRYIVKEGLKYLNTHHRQWVKTFLSTLDNNIKVDDFGFNLIPCINVTSRLTNAEESAIFLSRENYNESFQWFKYIKNLNETRKQKQEELLKEIENNYSNWLNHPFIIIPGENFTKGILGPVSGRLAEKYKKPTIVLTKNISKGIYSGSGRSIGEINILSLIKNNPYIIQELSGGHKAACGVGLKIEDLNNFWIELQKETKKIPLSQYIEHTKNSLGYLRLEDITLDLYNNIELFQPFGKDFEVPVFTIKGKVIEVKKIGKERNHLSLMISNLDNDDNNIEIKIKCLYFFYSTDIKKNTEITINCNIVNDNFNGKDKVALHIKEVLESKKIKKDKNDKTRKEN